MFAPPEPERKRDSQADIVGSMFKTTAAARNML